MFILSCTGGETGFGKHADGYTAAQGAGQITWSPTELLFIDLEPGGSGVSQTLTITSSGDNNLMVDRIDITSSGGGVFYMEEESDLTLAPEREKEIIVVATLPESGTDSMGELRIVSNDADHRDIRVPLCGYPVGYMDELICTPNDYSSDSGED